MLRLCGRLNDSPSKWLKSLFSCPSSSISTLVTDCCVFRALQTKTNQTYLTYLYDPPDLPNHLPSSPSFHFLLQKRFLSANGLSYHDIRVRSSNYFKQQQLVLPVIVFSPNFQLLQVMWLVASDICFKKKRSASLNFQSYYVIAEQCLQNSVHSYLWRCCNKHNSFEMLLILWITPIQQCRQYY